MTIHVIEDAEDDLRDGASFYDGQEAGLGDYFLNSVMADIESLHLFAGIHPIHFGVHRMLCKTFPFAVYYQREGEVVHVIAVLDQRRDPAWIRRRLER